jgi:hypothetical protein
MLQMPNVPVADGLRYTVLVEILVLHQHVILVAED